MKNDGEDITVGEDDSDEYMLKAGHIFGNRNSLYKRIANFNMKMMRPKTTEVIGSALHFRLTT